MSMSPFAMIRVVFVAVLCSAFIGAADAQVSPQLAQKAPEAAEIAATATQQGFVRVIAQIAAPSMPTELRPDAAFLDPIRSQIATLQDGIIASHFGNATSPSEGQGFSRNLVRFEIRPLIAVNVSNAELDALAADPSIVFIQYDRPAPPTLLQSVPLIGMTPAVYNAGVTGSRQAVAVLDTGAQANHQFLSGNMLLEACFSGASGHSLCPNGAKSQTGAGASNPTTELCTNRAINTTLCDHGTHVTGIAAGNNTNPGGGNPDNGVAKNAKIISIQVFSRVDDVEVCDPMRINPARTPCVLSYPSDRIRALDWLFAAALAPASGVRLAAVNVSIGDAEFAANCDLPSAPEKASIDTLRKVGVPTIIAAGNDGFTNAVNRPACISTAIAVGSSDKQDIISSFTNMSSLVALMAPGGFGDEPDGSSPPCMPGTFNKNILSSVSGTSSAITNGYGCMAGTSMAAPHVAGAFAAIRTVCPDATIDRIMAAFENTGVPIMDTRSAIPPASPPPNMRPAGTQTKPRISVDLARQALGCASHDFNGDGKSDLLWRDANGNLSVWLMNGARATSQTGIGTATPTWAIVGQRDFDGDGKYDLLWRDTSGNNSIWFMNGTQVKSQAGVSMLPTTWSVVGTGDFDASGFGGILWRDTAGNNMIWLMDGKGVYASGSLGPVPTTFSVAGTGDFDGDGKCDILWRDASGTPSIWFMDGTKVDSDAALSNVPLNFAVIGTGDFNGDGRTDIVWRDEISGNVSIWFMDAETVVSNPVIGNVPSTISLAQTGDYNGDGLSDLLWRDAAGNTSIWFMNGSQIASAQTVGTISPTFMLQTLNSN
jgi:Subtilase family/FG-GAP-like repeat